MTMNHFHTGTQKSLIKFQGTKIFSHFKVKTSSVLAVEYGYFRTSCPGLAKVCVYIYINVWLKLDYMEDCYLCCNKIWL